ncbi:hypothetical protein PC9H_010273 [Pleurotus ostreatus]|uniref:Mug135-like C-terminal domain-containing protein n=1 Tax=Pleurotus ostreatus TaxID=5322 RepID=A0A8H7DQD9_PLEOS|nr:uncharacterized protein PC9H_010273 [Pleurotus ostreatus]KAF7424962.1 hypothetical protein PC9H_010273 [Pleurotus ostreatus]
MPVALPELTQDRLQVLKVPDDPPNPANVAKAYILLNQASSRAIHYLDGRLISDDDICKVATYATQLITTRTGRPDIRDEVVAALRDTMPTLLQPVRNDITRVKTELAGARRDIRRNGRLIGLTWNGNSRPTDTATFEIVPFPNFEDPTTAPHNLPPLHSPQAIDELGPHHLRAYVRGYHPNLQAPGDRNECIKLVLTGIGAYGHVRE